LGADTTILLSTLAIAFAVFCVWLAVRIVNRRERRAKWTLAVMVGLPTGIAIGALIILAILYVAVAIDIRAHPR